MKQVGFIARLSRFLMFQRAAWRALFRRRRPAVLVPAAPTGIQHPSELCRCFGERGGQLGGDAYREVLADHDPGCAWVAAMCEGCAGTGWCVRCGGDGTLPDWDPDKTAPQRPSALRIA